MKTAVVIGASSGIGRALAVALSADGYRIGAVARRTDLLLKLQSELAGPCVIKTIDVSQLELAQPLLREMIRDLGDVDLFIVNAGTGFVNDSLAWQPESDTIGVNVLGFTGMVNVAVAHLESRRSGHLVGVSSLAGLRGSRAAPAYAASKAYVSNYLQGMRHRFAKLSLRIFVTDVQPGFVDTPMAGGNRFWISSPEKAARQIVAAIRSHKKVVYITRRWRLIAWLMRIVPDSLYSKI